ncbi:Druantia anti-phage system protein DruA [Rhizobacter sp. Root16D2]|uniref:Druantia anti-phage system protein DruA n=1 Tax=Rhizobacter sp. Root16D2 TaxID=1736479 RepID=UPI003514FBCB
MTVKNAVAAFTPEARIKRHLRKHLIDLGFTKDESGALVLPDASKDTVRTLHRKQREDKLAENAAFVSANLPNLQRYFASGADVRPEAIRPVLEPVTGEGLHARLFRLASLTWSVPVALNESVQERLLATAKWSVVVVNELLVRHHLPAACERVREVVASRQ